MAKLRVGTSLETAIEGMSQFMDDHTVCKKNSKKGCKLNAFDASVMLAYMFPDLDKEDLLDMLIEHRSKRR